MVHRISVIDAELGLKITQVLGTNREDVPSQEFGSSYLTPLLTAWYACIEPLGDVELSVQLLCY